MVLSSTTSTWLAFFSPTRELLFLPVSAFAQHRPTEETTAYRKGYQAQQVTKHYRLSSTTGYQAQQVFFNRTTQTNSGNTTNRAGNRQNRKQTEYMVFSAIVRMPFSSLLKHPHTPTKGRKKKTQQAQQVFFFLSFTLLRRPVCLLLAHTAHRKGNTKK